MQPEPPSGALFTDDDQDMREWAHAFVVGNLTEALAAVARVDDVFTIATDTGIPVRLLGIRHYAGLPRVAEIVVSTPVAPAPPDAARGARAVDQVERIRRIVTLAWRSDVLTRQEVLDDILQVIKG